MLSNELPHQPVPLYGQSTTHFSDVQPVQKKFIDLLYRSIILYRSLLSIDGDFRYRHIDRLNLSKNKGFDVVYSPEDGATGGVA